MTVTEELSPAIQHDLVYLVRLLLDQSTIELDDEGELLVIVPYRDHRRLQHLIDDIDAHRQVTWTRPHPEKP